MRSILSDRITASITGMVGLSMTWTMPSGAPAASAARLTRRAASAQQAFAIGCGLMMIAFRVISAMSAL